VQIETNGATLSLTNGAGDNDKPIRLLLAEELTLLRAALEALLSEQSDVEVVASLSCSGPIAQVVHSSRAEVAVIGVDRANSYCMAAVRDMRRLEPACRVVALTTPDTPDAPGMYAQLLAAPVDAIVDKNASPAELLVAIRAVAGGGELIPTVARISARKAMENPFSKREREVLTLAATGASANQIAHELHLTNGTVRNYLSSIMTKTKAHTRIDAIRTAQRYGWL
jgi:two-component system response regulator DesR